MPASPPEVHRQPALRQAYRAKPRCCRTEHCCRLTYRHPFHCWASLFPSPVSLLDLPPSPPVQEPRNEQKVDKCAESVHPAIHPFHCWLRSCHRQALPTLGDSSGILTVLAGFDILDILPVSSLSVSFCSLFWTTF